MTSVLIILAIGFAVIIAFVALCAVCMRWPWVLVAGVLLMLAWTIGSDIYQSIDPAMTAQIDTALGETR